MASARAPAPTQAGASIQGKRQATGDLHRLVDYAPLFARFIPNADFASAWRRGPSLLFDRAAAIQQNVGPANPIEESVLAMRLRRGAGAKAANPSISSGSTGEPVAIEPAPGPFISTQGHAGGPSPVAGPAEKSVLIIPRKDRSVPLNKSGLEKPPANAQPTQEPPANGPLSDAGSDEDGEELTGEATEDQRPASALIPQKPVENQPAGPTSSANPNDDDATEASLDYAPASSQNNVDGSAAETVEGADTDGEASDPSEPDKTAEAPARNPGQSPAGRLTVVAAAAADRVVKTAAPSGALVPSAAKLETLFMDHISATMLVPLPEQLMDRIIHWGSVNQKAADHGSAGAAGPLETGTAALVLTPNARVAAQITDNHSASLPPAAEESRADDESTTDQVEQPMESDDVAVAQESTATAGPEAQPVHLRDLLVIARPALSDTACALQGAADALQSLSRELTAVARAMPGDEPTARQAERPAATGKAPPTDPNANLYFGS